ncbi:hypothetical protein V5S96_01310 [Corynebacterium mastitidis]|uniref:Uncharacterized protein n=1 Tax=Corynebacterium mastitidis TaxID=161890 RepID=A0ABU8NVH5_9CORY
MSMFVVVALVAGLVIFDMWLKKDAARKDNERAYEGLNREDLLPHEHDFVQRFLHCRGAQEYFDRMKCYMPQPSAEGQEPRPEDRDYPEKKSIREVPTGIEVVFSLPVGMDFETFKGVLNRSGGLVSFGPSELRIEPAGPGKAKLVLDSRKPFEGTLSGAFIEG